MFKCFFSCCWLKKEEVTVQPAANGAAELGKKLSKKWACAWVTKVEVHSQLVL